jgi:hypothetical protein
MTSIKFRAPMILGALVLAAACGEKKDDALKADSTLGRDLAMAGQDTAAKPQLTDVPKAPPPPATKAATKTAPTATKTAPAKPTSGAIASGSILHLATAGDVCTNTNKVGDTFTATLNQGVTGTNGAAIPAGAVVTFSITGLSRSEGVGDKIEMVFAPKSVSFGGKTYPIEAALTPGFAVEQVKANAEGATAKKVVAGAAVGAIAGQLLGKNTKSTVVGAAAGAAAGAGVAAATTNYEGCVRKATSMTVTLSAALTVPVA